MRGYQQTIDFDATIERVPETWTPASTPILNIQMSRHFPTPYTKHSSGIRMRLRSISQDVPSVSGSAKRSFWSSAFPRLYRHVEKVVSQTNRISESTIMSDIRTTTTWPELAIGLYDKLTERNAEIAYQFENLEIGIPGSTDKNAERATWKLNGAVRVSTRSGVTT